MAIAMIAGISVSGMSVCVPKKTIFTHEIDWLKAEDRQKLVKATGIESRRVAAGGLTASDYSACAAEQLLASMDCDRKSIGALIFVTQHPDFLLPASAAILQQRLGLSNECACFDINLGCSGYVYGLWVAASLLGTMQCERALLLVGDTPNYVVADHDRTTGVLFSDAGSATLIEKRADASRMCFHLASDGQGHNAIIVPSGFRQRGGAVGAPTAGILRLDGAEVFNFSIREAPVSVRKALDAAGWKPDEPAHVVLHQANKMMNDTIARKLGLRPEQVPSTLRYFGNSSSVSIPLTLASECRDDLARHRRKVVLAGFGVGLSWGTVALELGPLQICPISEL